MCRIPGLSLVATFSPLDRHVFASLVNDFVRVSAKKPTVSELPQISKTEIINMDMSIYMQLLTADPVVTAKTTLRFMHFIGLALGLGAATLLDLTLLRFFVPGTITNENWKLVHFSANVVNFGLIVLWISGIGFIVHYSLFDPVKLTNEKIWAKFAIVGVLSVNGAFIHTVILPRIRAQVGKTLFAGMSRFQRSTFLVSGAISATSWYVPVVLGAFPQLNFSVPATTILLTYAVLLGLIAAVMHVVVPLIDPSRRIEQTAERDHPVLPETTAPDIAYYHLAAAG